MKHLLSFLLLFISASAVLSQSPRMSLYEEFTGETCPPCAATNPDLNKILLSAQNATRVIAIKWQIPIPSAPSNTWSLYQTNKNDINWRYRSVGGGGYGYPSQNNASSPISSGINSAPQGVLDGQHQWIFGAVSDHPAYISDAVLATAQSYTSAFNVNLKHEWNATKSAIIVTVNITASAAFNATGPLVFRCVMVERLIQFSVQPGSNGETTFEDVAISAYPTLQAGQSLQGNWVNGQTQSFTLSCTPPAYTRDRNQISLVGFIQDDGNRKVAQAARSRALYDAEARGVRAGLSCGPFFAPVADIYNAGLLPITAMTLIPAADGLVGTAKTWTGTLNPGASMTLTLNPVSSPQAAGPHLLSIKIAAMNGSDFNEGNNAVQVLFPVHSGPGGPGVKEGFVASVFPPAGWTPVSASAYGFKRSTEAGAYWLAPLESMKYDFFNNPRIGEQHQLYMPAMDLRGGDAIDVFFDYAYAQRSAQNNDRLELKVTADCGQNWLTVFSKSGTALATTGPTAGAEYVPDAADFSQWQTAQVALPGMNQGEVILKFEVTNDNGNALYIDNINVVQRLPSSVPQISGTMGLQAFPVPAKDALTLRFESEMTGRWQLSLYDGRGGLLLQKNLNVTTGSNEEDLDVRAFPEGLYLLELTSPKDRRVQKISLQR